jgi:hypothetical protein
VGADRLDSEAVAEHGVMPNLLQIGIGEPKARSRSEMHLLPAADLDVEPLIAPFDERRELVDREVVLHAVAEVPGYVARIFGERLRRLLRLPAPVFVVERLRQVPVVQRHERFDAGGEELVDEPLVEVETLRVRLPSAVGEDPRPGD